MFIGTQNNYLDRNFLKLMDDYTQREVYAKIISLSWDETAIAEITGNIASGNITVDGSSSTRRTCSLTVVTDNLKSDLNQIDWGINTKFAVLIGLKNYVDDRYDDIIWFQQGVFIITSFSQTSNTSGYTISIQGKDKMCLLDGSIGGALTADNDFGKLGVINDDGTESYEYIEIKNIIRDSVHKYGMEPYENIILSDIEDCAVELLDYKVANQGLFIYDISSTQDMAIYTSQMTFENQTIGQKFIEFALNNEDSDWYQVIPNPEYDINNNPGVPQKIKVPVFLNKPFQLQGSNLWYRIVKFVEYGETAGYRQTTLTYPGDLIVNAGSPLTQALDAVKNMLGEFEYYYDIYGRFIFQRKRVYHNIAWNGAVTNDDEDTYYDSINSTQSSYEFSNGFLISSFSNKPNLAAVRNDFSVWGTTTTNMPIHLRYAIDDRPFEYTSLMSDIRYYTKESVARQTVYNVEFLSKSDINCNAYSINKDKFLDELLFWGKGKNPSITLQELTGEYFFVCEKTGSSWNPKYEWKIYGRDYEIFHDENWALSEIWGVELPKSYEYVNYKVYVQFSITNPHIGRTDQEVDWRELIYQMALDNSRSEAYIQQLTMAMNLSGYDHYKPGFPEVSKNPDLTNVIFYNNESKAWENLGEKYGETNYDKLQDLHNKKFFLFGDKTKGDKNDFTHKTFVEEIEEWQNTWNTGYDAYYPDMLAFWRDLYDLKLPGEVPQPIMEPGMSAEDFNVLWKQYREEVDFLARQNTNKHWNPDIIQYIDSTDEIMFLDPGRLLFWIDFIGEGSAIEKYKVALIGRRSKSVKDNDVKAIFFRDTPEVLFIDPANTEPPTDGISYVRLTLSGGLVNYFHNSSQGKSAKEELDNLVYQHTYYQESIQLTSLPVYYLEPNVRISVADEATGIRGDYFVKSFNYSFAYDGTMSISATRAADRIL